ncbi:Starch-binding associating with outer membrane [Arachidicoccus rhizosphaerae]|uniref:Starch-binding associating with outer membrane n=1 Tax=Arachidicoccus rhizosphaerae TaxID=551991 RepID=A0A1H4AS47_9BACT|nr:RagB/SusD family nutrient uptake outer membrane protein [Arachidicoccus rhizosphaerae]SEA38709.1 Starch-binding associating with outer membrane [Arachidicoccus rhizosphaerae]
MNIKIKSFANWLTCFSTAVLLMGSCKHYLDLNPVSSFGPDVVFGTVENAQKAVLGAYQDLAGDNGYGIRISMYFPYDNDCMMGAGGHGDGDRRDISRYNVTASNAQLYNPFNRLYQGIENANQCIKYIPQMDLYANGTASQKGELQRLYGEALTLRAQFFFELVRNWGDVPAEWEPSSDVPDLFLAKTDRDSIYDHILDDLATAEQLVPWRSEISALGDATDERITKGAVKGLRARIALFRGGYSLRRATNAMQRDADYLTFYKIADTECASIIHSGEHALDPSFEDLWRNQVDAHQIDPYGEMMFEVAMGGATSTTDSKLGKYNGPGGSLTILPTYFYMFDSTDRRRDVTIAPYKIASDNTLTAASLNGLYDGKFRRNWFTNPSVDISNQAQNFGINWPILRYSDVLLMYAETQNELNGGPTADAIEAYQKVRNRAFNNADPQTVPTTKDGFFDALVNERALEFGTEGIRKYDLIRWNLLSSKLAATKTALAAMNANESPYDKYPQKMYYLPSTSTTDITWVTSFYTPAPGSTPSGATGVSWVGNSILNGNLQYFAEGFQDGHSELLPIPQAAIDANPKLTQDFGY